MEEAHGPQPDTYLEDREGLRLNCKLASHIFAIVQSGLSSRKISSSMNKHLAV